MGGIAGLVLIGCLGLFALLLYKRDKVRDMWAHALSMRQAKDPRAVSSSREIAPSCSTA